MEEASDTPRLEKKVTKKSLNKKIDEQSLLLAKMESYITHMKHERSREIQEKSKDYEYLVFSGGGIKGIAYTGALNELQKHHIIYDENGKFKLKGIAGTSAGSIIAALLAVGYKPNELSKVMAEIEFDKILDDKCGYLRDAYNLITDWGLCPGNYVLQLMGDYITKKVGNPDYTLEDLYHDKE